MARLSRGRARRETERRKVGSSLMFWLRLIIAFVLVALLVVQVMRLFDYSFWRQSELDTAVYRFGQTAMLVNSEWLRAGRQGPVEVQLGGQEGVSRSIIVHVNDSGWPLAQQAGTSGANSVILAADMTSAGCATLWSLLSQAPELLQLGLEAEWQADDGLCVYRFNDQEQFTYRLQNGHLKTL